MEVRDAYCKEDFEWDQLQKVAISDMQKANIKLLRDSAATFTFKSMDETDSPDQGPQEGDAPPS